MEITEHAIHMLAEVERSVQDHYCDFTDLAHGFEHVQRVYHLAMQLAEQERADGFIVGIAALKHLEQVGLEVVKSISIAKLDDLPAQGSS